MSHEPKSCPVCGGTTFYAEKGRKPRCRACVTARQQKRREALCKRPPSFVAPVATGNRLVDTLWHTKPSDEWFRARERMPVGVGAPVRIIKRVKGVWG